MKLSRDFDSPGLYRALERRELLEDLIPIDVLVAVINEENLWSDEFLDKAIEQAKKEAVRTGMRRGLPDEDGVLHKSMGIEEFDAETGESKPGYKQLEFFDKDNCEWAMAYRARRARTEVKKFQEAANLCTKKYGRRVTRQIQGRLGFMDELIAMFKEPAEAEA